MTFSLCVSWCLVKQAAFQYCRHVQLLSGAGKLHTSSLLLSCISRLQEDRLGLVLAFWALALHLGRPLVRFSFCWGSQGSGLCPRPNECMPFVQLLWAFPCNKTSTVPSCGTCDVVCSYARGEHRNSCLQSQSTVYADASSGIYRLVKLHTAGASLPQPHAIIGLHHSMPACLRMQQ